MKKKLQYPVILASAIASLCLLSSLQLPKTHYFAEYPQAASEEWGFFGHKKISELAVYTLPQEMFGFYKANMDFLVTNSVNPDKRRYAVVGEAECHYIDMDRYITNENPNPFDNIPKKWTDAVAKFGEDTLRANGIVPWHVNRMYYRLIEAFKELDKSKILRISTELAHYVGDAHVPLHTTSNYNGQLTGQRGIHGFWESRLVELYAQDFDFFVGKAEYIESPQIFIWERIEESFAAVDSVLHFEKTLQESFPPDKKYSFESRGRSNAKVYSEEYSRAYNEMLDGQVERRMKSAVLSAGSYWYTAWVDAGQPHLYKLLTAKQLLEDSDSLWQNNISPTKIREHE